MKTAGVWASESSPVSRFGIRSDFKAYKKGSDQVLVRVRSGQDAAAVQNLVIRNLTELG